MHQDEKVKALSQKLLDGVQQTFESNRFKQYLKTVSAFHSYSPRNVALIFLQNPAATYVAGFGKWKELNRYVRRGETGISIFAPTKITEKQKKPMLDDDGNTIFDDDGNPQMEDVQETRIRFHIVSVFDVSQTDGDPLPALCDELQGAVPDFQKIFAAIRNISPYQVTFEQINGDEKGYCRYSERKIAIRTGMSDEQIIKTLIHEFAHSMLHEHSDKSTVQREIEAESVAFIVSDFLGIDTSGYSFDYVSVWSQGMDVEQLQGVLEGIQNTACDIIHRIETEVEKLERTKSLESQKLPERLSKASTISEKLNSEKEVIPNGKLLAK